LKKGQVQGGLHNARQINRIQPRRAARSAGELSMISRTTPVGVIRRQISITHSS
jgi:hypothetical protein